MAIIRNFTRKAAKTRARVRKHRLLKKLKINYENEVQNEMKRRQERNWEDFQNTEMNSCEVNSCETNSNFEELLKSWSIKHRITKMALNDLLAILIFAGFTFLPKDCRTLMKTPTHIDIKKLTKGSLWYNGVERYLLNLFQTVKHVPSKITLDFNFDGVPLFNSSKKCFWPILASIRGKLKLCVI